MWLDLGHLLKDSEGIFIVLSLITWPWLSLVCALSAEATHLGRAVAGASVSVLQSHMADCPSSTCSLCSQVSATLEIR